MQRVDLLHLYVNIEAIFMWDVNCNRLLQEMFWKCIACSFFLPDEVAGYSGDFGSAVGWEDEEEKETEDNGEEAEEEEGEVGEVDDGGYIW